MIKKTHFMIIALIALVAFIIMPVSAYTEYWNHDFTGTGEDKNIEGIVFNHAEHGSDITRITYSGHLYVQSTDRTGNFDIVNYIFADHDHGHGTWTQDCSATGNWSADCTIDITLAFEPKGDTGEQYYEMAVEGNLNSGFFWPSTLTAHTDGATLSSHTADDHAAAGRVYQYSTAPANGLWTTYYGTNVVTPVSSFTCTPTSQYPDTSVVCTDTSTNTPTDWYWTIDAEAMGIDAWQTHTGQNFTWESHYPGFYSVNLRANNSAGFSWENKTNYVSISVNATPNNCDIEPATGYVRTYAQTNDGMTSGGIYNSNIQMKDVEGSAWSNVTNSGGWWCIDTLPGHTLNLYAQATGYTDVESIGVAANGGRHYLVMWPDYIPAPSAGNITLYAMVYDQQTGAPLYLSSVRVDGNTINTVVKNTGPEGQAMFTIKNDSSIHVTASKSGYSTITKVMTTSHLGPDTIMISLPRTSITATATATPTPSWMTPVTTIDTRTNFEKQTSMVKLIYDNGEAIIGFCILLFFIGGMKMVMK